MAEKIVKDSQGLAKDLVNDCIRRQAAIDAVMRNACNTQRIYEAIKGLPSEQPETHDKRTETHACDCISKTAAIDIVEFECGEWRGLAKTIAEEIEQLPSAQPERKRGRWIIKDNPGTGWYRVTCSECGEDVTSTAPCIGFYPNAKVTWDYCPNCGADMREVDDE